MYSSPPPPRKLTSFTRRTHAPCNRKKKPTDSSSRVKKYKTMANIMARAKYAVVEKEDYSDCMCERCGSGEQPKELLLCDKCDKGFHMKCLRPILARVPIGSWICPKCCSELERQKSK